MANKGRKVSSYELESASRKGASKDLKKLGVEEGKWDKKEGQNGRRRKGSIERQN